MAEGPYVAAARRDDGSVPPVDLIAAFERGIADLKGALAGMPAGEWAARPIPGQWSTLEVVAHLVSTEIYFSDRVERTIALERPLLMGVDERPYPARLNFEAYDMEEQLALFEALRRHITRVLRLQSEESWVRTAVHSELGLVTLRQLVLLMTGHVAHHLGFIAAKRRVLEGADT